MERLLAFYNKVFNFVSLFYYKLNNITSSEFNRIIKRHDEFKQSSFQRGFVVLWTYTAPAILV